ncbi:MAG: hypothetical protein M3Z08_15300 [Chloroflexota bacterium]|nr:hypothetical protein [Chloroflexota bacterium]
MTRCTNCGLPLSPARTYTRCPRCDIALGNASGPNAAVTAAPHSYDQDPNRGAQAGMPSSPNNAWGQAPSSSITPTSPWNQSPAGPSPLQQAPQPQQPWLARALSQPPPNAGQRPASFSRHNRGFVVSAILLGTAALILIFVYIMATNFLSAQNGPDTATTHPAPQASATTPASSPTSASSPTATALPAQQYIDNAQTASAVDTTTSSSTQPSTTFKINQKIYVTFNIHPNGKNGAVCLLWFLNSKHIAQFALPVTSMSKAGYSYAIYAGTGPGYVNIYWASTTRCTDKLLAQHVDFTVTH